MKYSEIKTMDELDKARHHVKSRLVQEDKLVKVSLLGIRQAYSPSNLLVSGLRSASTVFPFDRILLSLVRRTRSLLLK
jgi:hypothetical protein